MTSHYLSSEEVAKQLDITVDAVNELREAFKIRAFRDGAGWRFRAEDVEKYRSIRDAASTSGDLAFNADSSDSERGSSSSEIPLGDGSGSFSAFLMDDSPSADLTATETNAAGSSDSVPLSDSSSSVDIAKAMSQLPGGDEPLNLEEDLFNDELKVDDTSSGSIDVNRLVQDGGSGSIRLSSPPVGDVSGSPELSLSKGSPSDSSPELLLSKDSPSDSSPELLLSKDSPSDSSPLESESVDLEGALQLSKPSSGVDSGLT